MKFMHQYRLYSPNSQPNGGSGGDNNQNDQGNQSDGSDGGNGSQNGNPNVNQSYQNLLQRQGNDTSAISWLLFNENHQHRQTINSLQSQVQELQGQIPSNGSVVLDGDAASLWASYQALGTPEEISTQRDAYNTLQTDLSLRDAADLHGYKVSVLKTLVSNDGLTIEVRDSDNGRSAFVVTPEGEADIALPAYADSHWQDFAPSLAAKQQQGAAFFKQNTGGKQSPASAIQAELNKRYDLPA
ncbi:MAG: hypothetical protein IAF02_25115 [Anaerolineae bacterium]|nr:hypothetical protein [Anaerolineae bacterium]